MVWCHDYLFRPILTAIGVVCTVQYKLAQCTKVIVHWTSSGVRYLRIDDCMPPSRLRAGYRSGYVSASCRLHPLLRLLMHAPAQQVGTRLQYIALIDALSHFSCVTIYRHLTPLHRLRHSQRLQHLQH
jgi:hypothetical protein